MAKNFFKRIIEHQNKINNGTISFRFNYYNKNLNSHNSLINKCSKKLYLICLKKKNCILFLSQKCKVFLINYNYFLYRNIQLIRKTLFAK